VLNEIDWFRGRALVALDMGLGKTFVSLKYLRDHPQTSPTVVVCPASVKYHWERETLRHTHTTPLVAEGRKPPKGSPDGVQFVIVNYDILPQWLRWLRRLNPRSVILDECQMIANPQAQRTKAVQQLCNESPCVLGLSGTPLLNRPIEIYNILNILSPKMFSRRWDFIRRYCDLKVTPWGWDYKGASHTGELNRILSSSVMIRRRMAEVLSELPEKIRSVIPIPLSEAAKEEYNRATLDFATWLREEKKKTSKNNAEALVKIGYLLRLIAELKLPSIIEWVNSFLENSDEKLLVFAVHKKIISGLRNQCRAKSIVIDGSVTGRARQAAVDQFVEDPDTRLLIGNIQAAGVGIDRLQYVCSTAMFAELPWQPGAAIQAEGRLWRIGTKSTAWMYYLVAHGTIEEKLCGILQSKQEVLSSVLDGKKMDGDISIYDQLMSELVKEVTLGGEKL